MAFRVFWRYMVAPPRSKWTRYGATLLWAGGIFVLSSIPGNRYPKVYIPNADKGVHAFLFWPLGWLLARSLHGNVWWRTAAGALVACAAYGLSDEVHQIWVPFRTFSWADWTVDCIASGVGIAAWLCLARHPLSGKTAPSETPAQAPACHHETS